MEKITDAPALAESAIKRNGFDKPLISSGHMLNSVTHKIISGGGED